MRQIIYRYVFIVFLLMIPLSVFSQIRQFNICGIPTGTDKEEAKSILKSRFGEYSVYDNRGDLRVYDGRVGGVSYKFLDFYFTMIGGIPRLNGASFSTPFNQNEIKDALKYRECVKEIYEQKYIISEFVEDGFKCYYFGDEADDIGCISLHKGKSKDGKTRLYVAVDYFGPYSKIDDI